MAQDMIAWVRSIVDQVIVALIVLAIIWVAPRAPRAIGNWWHHRGESSKARAARQAEEWDALAARLRDDPRAFSVYLQARTLWIEAVIGSSLLQAISTIAVGAMFVVIFGGNYIAAAALFLVGAWVANRGLVRMLDLLVEPRALYRRGVTGTSIPPWDTPITPLTKAIRGYRDKRRQPPATSEPPRDHEQSGSTDA